MNFKSRPKRSQVKSRRTRKTERKARYKNNKQLKRTKPPAPTPA